VIASELQCLADRQPDATALITEKRRWTYSQLVRAAHSVARTLTDGRPNRVGVWCEETPLLLATLVALDSVGVDAMLIPATATIDHVGAQAEKLGLTDILTDRPKLLSHPDSQELRFRPIDVTLPIDAPGGSSRAHESRIILFTSGTSGRPKPATHVWRTLSAAVNRDPKYAGRRWLLAYEPTSFAGIQVWLQALLTGGSLIILDSREPAAAAERLVEEKVEFASATPSFWRLLLLSVDAEKLSPASLGQITLGGEPVDQPILDALRAIFPRTRITHIYASTEMGVCFSVSDGRAGFPASYLADPKQPVGLRISDAGELEVRSPRAMLGYLPESIASGPIAADQENRFHWFATGDLVERRDDRIYFVGRKSETINVGGMKVYPHDVEQCIRMVPGVQEVRVHAVPSSITGQIVGADIQPASGANLYELQQQVIGLCRKRLARHQVPTSIKFCERLPLSESGKVLRGEAVDHV
jgi:acyl-CoA synthetase (AMP-forming)/AMP-acid ligase II